MKQQELHSSLKGLENHRVLGHFWKLCAIPHPSHGEEAISRWIAQWAQEQGLEVKRDSANNVYIRREASPGREKELPLLLQAHTDMVCQKASGVEHDFDRDPICPVREGDIISTGGRTTLGADNCIGVALAMAALAEDISHPAIEALFTTAEEDDFSGAKAVDGSWFRSRQLVNLDNAVEGLLLVGSCGGTGLHLRLPFARQAAPAGCVGVGLTVNGLVGGHSGGDIHRGRGNAGILLARFLRRALAMGCRLSSFTGGNFRLSLPRRADMVLAVPGVLKDRLTAEAAAFEKALQAEYTGGAPELTLTLREEECPRTVLAEDDARRFTQAMYLAPNGIAEMSGIFENVVNTSDNVGEAAVNEQEVRITAEIRAAYDSGVEWLEERFAELAELLGGKVETFSRYPGWQPDIESSLCRRVARLMEEQQGTAPRITAMHGGLECGCLIQHMPGMTAVSIGPNQWGLHSPDERMSLSSVDRTWTLLTALLAEKSE